VPARENLLSPSSASTVSAAFETLANNVLEEHSRTLEDIVREMLRPMLKQWLEENLPGLVERLVRAEIERVSRGAR
jgi:cell pole-organizing protein PopZ